MLTQNYFIGKHIKIHRNEIAAFQSSNSTIGTALQSSASFPVLEQPLVDDKMTSSTTDHPYSHEQDQDYDQEPPHHNTSYDDDFSGNRFYFYEFLCNVLNFYIIFYV